MIRDTIRRELKRRKWSAYRLAQESGLKLRGVQDFMAGTAEMNCARLEHVFKALDLELRPKRKGG